MNEILLAKAADLVGRCTAHSGDKLCFDWVMSLIDEQGYPTASMITASRADGLNWVTFCTGLGSNKPNRARNDSRASIYLFEKESFSGISLTGRIEIITDLEVKKQMWYDGLAQHFKGPEDENLCVLKFKTERYNIFLDYENIYGDWSV